MNIYLFKGEDSFEDQTTRRVLSEEPRLRLIMAIEIPATAAEREEFLFNYNQRKQTNREMIPLEEVSEKETRLRELPRAKLNK